MAKSKDSVLSELTLSERMLAERAQVAAAAEEMVKTSIVEDRELRFDELEVLTGEVGWDKQKIAAERRRLGRVVRLQMVVGDSKARAEVSAKLADAESVVEKRGPELQNIIDAATTELASLTKNRDTLSRLNSEIEAGLESLKELVSPCVAARCSAKRATIKQTLGREYQDALGELSEIESLLAGPAENESLYWSQLKLYDRELVAEKIDDRNLVYHYSAKWPAFKTGCESELPGRRAKVAQLKEKFDSELAAVNELLTQYWN